MKAAVCRRIDHVEIEELEDPHPLTGEVRLRMVATGVCGTDLSIFHGHLPSPFPIVLGHEGTGIVEEVGPGVQKLAVGDHVVLKINGVTTVDYHEPDSGIARDGIISLQIHSGPPMEIRFKDIRIKELGANK